MKKKLTQKQKDDIVRSRFYDSIKAGYTTVKEVEKYIKEKNKKEYKSINKELYNRPAKIIYGHNTK